MGLEASSRCFAFSGTGNLEVMSFLCLGEEEEDDAVDVELVGAQAMADAPAAGSALSFFSGDLDGKNLGTGWSSCPVVLEEDPSSLVAGRATLGGEMGRSLAFLTSRTMTLTEAREDVSD